MVTQTSGHLSKGQGLVVVQLIRGTTLDHTYVLVMIDCKLDLVVQSTDDSRHNKHRGRKGLDLLGHMRHLQGILL